MPEPKENRRDRVVNGSLLEPDFDDINEAELELIEAINTHGSLAPQSVPDCPEPQAKTHA